MSDLTKRSANARFAAAFTLMELMVSIGILVVIILSVGVIFGGASRSVSVSQATMEMMSNVRAVEKLVESDVASIDKSTFLVIRSRLQDTTAPIFPATSNTRHFDQVAFVTVGSFPSRTGTNTANPFDDTTVAGAAHVWWGQLTLEHAAPLPNASYVLPNQGAVLPLDALPTGAYLGGVGPTPYTVIENQFTLGRHATLLFPGPANANAISPAGIALPAYASIGRPTPAITGGGDSGPAHITSSRFANAAMSPSQLMQELGVLHQSDPFAEATFYCYRFRALASIYDNTDETAHPFVSGYYRMHPVALQGVSSFAVDWTDGSTVTTPGPELGQLRWYNYFAPKGDPNVEQVFAGGEPNLKDNYIAVFNAKNRRDWPKALRFTYHVADVNNRLQGGRDFVQVVKLPG